MDTTPSTLLAAEQALLKQAFFASPQTRTIPRIVAWVEKALCAKSVTKAKSEMAAIVANYPSHDEGVREVAVRLLRGTGLLRVEEVHDIDSCADHLGTWTIDGRFSVLADDVLANALDAVPGGAEFLARSGSELIRFELLRLGFGPEQLGNELIHSFLMRNECAPGALDAANRILSDPRRALGPLLNSAALALPEEDRVQIEKLYNRIGSVNPVSVLIAPNLARLRPALVKYLLGAPAGLGEGVRADLLTVFNPTAHYVRSDQNYGEHPRLMQVVYDALVESSLLVSGNFDSTKNLSRVATALDRFELDVRQLHSYEKLYSLCRTDERSYSRKKEAVPTNVERFSTLAEGYAAIEAVARDRGVHRGRRLILPTRAEFSAASFKTNPVAAIEIQTGQTYEAVLSYLAQRGGYAVPGRSEPHRVMNRLVVGALSGRIVGDIREEYTDADLFGRQRIDLFVCAEYQRPGELLPTVAELCFEADGSQHFTSVEYWGGNSKQRDQMKAQKVLHAATTRPMSLIALHHEVLTGARSKLVSGANLAGLIDYVVEQRHPWVFVRPVGSHDMKSTPRGLHPVPLHGVIGNARLEVFVLPPVN